MQHGKLTERKMNKIIRKIRRYLKQASKESSPAIEEIDSKQYRDFTDTDKEIFKLVKSFTMTSPERIKALIDAVAYIENNNLEGDFVECGVWKGGSSLAAALMLNKLNSYNRNIWLFDTFEGMSKPTSDDVDLNGKAAERQMEYEDKKTSWLWGYSELEEVKRNVSISKYPQEKIFFIKGKVEDTLVKDHLPEKIALLRLDTDWYESTLIEMQVLFPKLVQGGIVIIDDYGHWQGCKKAVDEYLQNQGLKVYLHRIDYTGRLLVKF